MRNTSELFREGCARVSDEIATPCYRPVLPTVRLLTHTGRLEVSMTTRTGASAGEAGSSAQAVLHETWAARLSATASNPGRRRARLDSRSRPSGPIGAEWLVILTGREERGPLKGGAYERTAQAGWAPRAKVDPRPQRCTKLSESRESRSCDIPAQLGSVLPLRQLANRQRQPKPGQVCHGAENWLPR